jgi:mRNA-degrading endonuclease RelE of RelBE toxin-antitoxin system
MSSSYTVKTTLSFDRSLRKLNKRHPDLADILEQAITVLETDPYNRMRTHNIKKLEGQKAGSGQYRLRLGRWRFRYDIAGSDVVLAYCGLRREDTYRK